MGIVLEGLIPSRNSYPETQYFEGNKLPGKPYFFFNPNYLAIIGYKGGNFLIPWILKRVYKIRIRFTELNVQKFDFMVLNCHF